MTAALGGGGGGGGCGDENEENGAATLAQPDTASPTAANTAHLSLIVSPRTDPAIARTFA